MFRPLLRLLDRILEAVEDAKDRRSARKRSGVTVPAEQLWAELGLDV
ncbi:MULTISPECIES: hypothetical protein [unclassified Mycobacterium]|nr:MULTISPECIES: hypothetical protein [unclassified Mycobacterium]